MPIWFWQIAGERIGGDVAALLVDKGYLIRALASIGRDKSGDKDILCVAAVAYGIAVAAGETAGIRVDRTEALGDDGPVSLKLVKGRGDLVRLIMCKKGFIRYKANAECAGDIRIQPGIGVTAGSILIQFGIVLAKGLVDIEGDMEIAYRSSTAVAEIFCV